MATTLQSSQANISVENFTFQSPSLVNTATGTEDQLFEQQQIQLQVGQLLQTSLELEKILDLFFSKTQEYLEISSLGYRNEQFSFILDYGHSNPHSCHYSLQINGANLGDLILTRSQRFKPAELTLIEALIGSLICPIRNALLYKEALMAALKDPLTQLGNRKALETTLEREISLAKRHQHAFSLLIVDIDYFKKINDQYGHSAGDAVLKAVATTLNQCCRETDASYRYGGEEFVLLLNQTDSAGSQLIAERIRSSIEQSSCKFEQDCIQVTVSIGTATLNENETSMELFNRADKALYIAKYNGRNLVIQS